MLKNHQVAEAREDFPILSQVIGRNPLVYLDNAATTQIPLAVQHRIAQHYASDNANVHRGIHTLSERSTAALERARNTVAAFINASDAKQIIFSGGTTASINMVARGVEHALQPSQAIVVTALEHHANFVPWQQLCQRVGAQFLVAPLTSSGDLDFHALDALFRENQVFLFAFAHVSNVLGTTNPVADLTALAHRHGAKVLVDAAQSIRHELIDVQAIDCDYLAFSGHKMMAPTGIGVLYGKMEALELLNPSFFGGEMVDSVNFERTTYEQLPLRLEAGTPNYVGAIGLGAACDYLEGVGREGISAYEAELLNYAEMRLEGVDGVNVLGNPSRRAGCLSFTVDGLHPFDIAKLLDAQGIAIRSGNQCAQPLLHCVYGIQNVSRISPAFYNTFAEIDTFSKALSRTISVLRTAV